MKIKIQYLGCKGIVDPPAPITLDYDADGLPTIRVGWADRTDDHGGLCGRPSVWAQSGDIYAVCDDQGLRVFRCIGHAKYPLEGVAPEWCDHLAKVRGLVIDALVADRSARPEVEAACAAYESIVADIHREYTDHEKDWMRWVAEIAKKFRRKNISVEEQTVPGKCCVRSSRGRLLGYADVWDGRWLGTIERI